MIRGIPLGVDGRTGLLSPIARPLAKSVIKGGLIAYRQVEQLYAGAVEGIGDVVAETQQEIGTATPARGRTDGGGSRAS